MRKRDKGVQIKSPAEVEKMRAAGLVVGKTLELLRAEIRPGMTTADLDVIAEAHIRGCGAVPSFKGYHGFPASICASVNEEIVHGIPGSRVIQEGDIVSLDCGAIVDGWHGDSAVTIGVGSVAPELVELMRVCEESLWRGMAAARLSGRVSDIGHAIETYVDSQGTYGIVQEYVGHGIGTEMHQAPQVPNYGRPGRLEKLRKGLVLAVEPMVNLGSRHTRTLADGWTVVTADGSYSAHFEHTFTLTDSGPYVLTALDGGKARFAELFGVADAAAAGT
jgi:methionyl aminopeptidase